MAQEKGLASECRKLLLAIMIFEPEDRDTARIESAKATSKAIAEKILEIWLKKSGIAKAEGNQTARYMEDQIKIVLMELGKRKPQVSTSGSGDGMILIAKGALQRRQQILRPIPIPHSNDNPSCRPPRPGCATLARYARDTAIR